MTQSPRRFFALFSPQFGRFLIVGGIATTLHYAILLALTVSAGFQPLLASSIGFVASASASYTLNRRFTFHSGVDYLAGLQRFGLIAGGGFVLNTVVLTAGMDLSRVNYITSQLAATGVVLLWNFHANRLWTFSLALSERAKPTEQDSPQPEIVL